MGQFDSYMSLYTLDTMREGVCVLGNHLFLQHLVLQFSSVQSLSRVQLSVNPWTAARQASLSITNSQSLLKLMSIELVDSY